MIMGQTIIPDEIRPFFWDVDIKNLDLNDHQKYIIERLLNEGDHRAVKWLFQTFSLKQIKNVVLQSRGLSLQTALCWQNFFQLKEEENGMFWNVLDEARMEILRKIIEIEPVPRSFLSGGTGLALMLGHRESIDFEWITPEVFQIHELIDKLAMIGKVEITDAAEGNFRGFIDNVRVTWLHCPNPMMDNLVEEKQIPGLKIASLKDIGLLKWIALSQRGARNDFVDLYWICQQNVSLELLYQLMPQKFPGININYYHLIKSLSYFKDAERELMPVMRGDPNWEIIKEYFKNMQRELLEKGRQRSIGS